MGDMTKHGQRLLLLRAAGTVWAIPVSNRQLTDTTAEN